MTKRERKYHSKRKVHQTIVGMLTEKIREAIDDEIIQILRKIASGETEAPKEILLPNKK